MDEVVCVSVLDEDFKEKVKNAKRIKIIGDSSKLENNLFCGNKLLEYVEISENIEEIGESCFQGCSNLKEVILPNGLKTIGARAFYSTSLENVVIPGSVLEISGEAFQSSCINNIYISNKSNLKVIGSCAFKDCNFKSIAIPDSVLVINDRAFLDCWSLEKVEISSKSNLKKIGHSVFSHCKSLKNIFIPINVTELGEYAFNKCYSLEKIDLPDDIEELKRGCFSFCKKIKRIKFPSNLKKIGYCAFSDCESLENIVLPDSVLEIDTYAFSGCSSLKKIDLSKKLNTLNVACFDRCKNLKSITIPNSLQSINKYAFAEYCKIENIIFCYESYDKLVNFISENQKLFEQLNTKTKICFSGPKLSIVQRYNITHLCKLNVSFVKENENNSKEVNVICNDGDDISNIINEINMLCDKLPNELKDIINKKVNDLLVKYNEDKERLFPKYGVETPVLSFGDISVNELRPKLLSDLGMIKLSLTTKGDIIKFIGKLEVCSNILDKEVDELLDDYDSIEDMVRNIMYYSKYLDDYRKNRYRNKVRWIIQYAVITAGREFTESNNELKLNDKLDVKLEFRLKLTNLYNEIEGLVSNTIPFKNLSMALKSNNEVDSVGDDIKSFLECIRYAINHISNTKYGDELNGIYSNIINKYSEMVDNFLEKPGTLDELKYEKVEFGLRSELQSLLEVIRDVLFISDYELKISDNSIINQLNRCLGIIHDGEIVNITEKEEKEALVYSVILINNSVISDSNLSNDTKNLILLDLVDIINRNIKEIGDSIIDVNEYRTIQINILKEIMRVKLKYENYISDVDKYKKCLK